MCWFHIIRMLTHLSNKKNKHLLIIWHFACKDSVVDITLDRIENLDYLKLVKHMWFNMAYWTHAFLSPSYQKWEEKILNNKTWRWPHKCGHSRHMTTSVKKFYTHKNRHVWSYNRLRYQYAFCSTDFAASKAINHHVNQDTWRWSIRYFWR